MPRIKVSTSCLIYISLVIVFTCFPITSRAAGPCRDLVVGRCFEKAIAECTAGINTGKLSNTALSDMHTWRGFAYKETGDTGKAMIDFERAISLNPGNEMPYIGRALAYERDRDYASARADFSRAIGINPQNQAAWEHRGILSYVEGKYKDAVNDLSRATELDPKNPRALSFRGNTYAALNESEKALKD